MRRFHWPWAVAVLLLFAGASAEASISFEEFAADPAMGAPKISPNGRYVAFPRRTGKFYAVIITDLDAPAGTKPGAIGVPAGAVAEWVEWANDDRLLIGLAKYQTARYRGETYDTSLSRVVAIGRDGQNIAVLFENNRRFRHNFDLGEIAHPLPDDPDAVLMAAYDRQGRNNLYRVNVNTGKAETVQVGSDHTFRWLTDLQGVPRVRWDYRPGRDQIEIYVRKGDSSDWDMVTQYGDRDLPDMTVVGFGDDPKVALVSSRLNGDRAAIYQYDLVTHALGTQVFQSPTVDVGDPVGRPLYDPETTKLIGVSYVEDVWRVHYFEDTLAKLEQKLEAALPGMAIVRPISWARDHTRAIVVAEGPKDPRSYYVYDVKRGSTSPLGRSYPNIPPNELGEMRVIKFNARDGTKIPGYLTLPPGKGNKQLPLVVMPHGGPELRDYVQYDSWVQALANRGYAVFQPNFRGSGGYGRAFAEAGHRQWGRRMQDDITDGVKALVADGTADPNRMCIVGASYGGYAALAGGAFTPDLYKCVVAIAGVSDIPAMVEEEEDRFGEQSRIYEYWVKRLGKPKTDLSEMQQFSPALQAQSFKVPVLLIHGDQDQIVPIDQSKRMDKALRAAGKQVRFVTIEDEGHNFGKPESQIRVLSEIEQFLVPTIGK